MYSLYMHICIYSFKHTCIYIPTYLPIYLPIHIVILNYRIIFYLIHTIITHIHILSPGITQLIPDPHFKGSGVHQTLPGGRYSSVLYCTVLFFYDAPSLHDLSEYCDNKFHPVLLIYLLGHLAVHADFNRY